MQQRRLYFQIAFFAVFLLAPALDLLRFDLNETQLWFLGQRWSLGIDEFRAGRISVPMRRRCPSSCAASCPPSS
jgi:ferredoxin-type protein NapH